MLITCCHLSVYYLYKIQISFLTLYCYNTFSKLKIMSLITKLGIIPQKRTVFFLCDLQESFRNVANYFSEICTSANKLVSTSKLMGIPLIVTEQYPQKLGKTVSDIDITHATKVFAKTRFSMVIPEVMDELSKLCDGQVECIVLFGIEAHICVEQTAIDLLGKGFTVHVIADATSSRSQEDRILAFHRLRQMGCFISTTESILFKLLECKESSFFKDVQQLVKSPTPNTGLAGMAKM